MLCVAAERHFDLSFSFPNRMGRNRFFFSFLFFFFYFASFASAV